MLVQQVNTDNFLMVSVVKRNLPDVCSFVSHRRKGLRDPFSVRNSLKTGLLSAKICWK